jgi:hypothetical protein
MRVHDPLANLRNPDQGTQQSVPHTPLPNPSRNDTVEDQKYNALYKLMLDHRLEAQRIARMAFSYTHPVDEYETIGTNASTLPAPGLVIRSDTDYDERIESILISLPLGTTSANLLIGTDRVYPLYSGAAITVQQPLILPHLGIIIGSGDERYLQLAGALTTNGFVELMGYALTRGYER